MSKKLKVGVIGVGGIARVHFPGWHASEHTELAAFADVNRDVMERVAKTEGVDRLYDDPMDLIKDKDIDIVDVVTPNAYHAPLSIAAMRAGKHVLCEKPLAPHPKAIKKMIEVRNQTGRKLMTAQHFRWMNQSRALQAEIDNGALGEVYHARSWFLRRARLPYGPGFIYKKNSGGGACIDIGVHMLDLTLHMMGNPKPVTVSGVVQTRLAKLPKAFTLWGGPIVDQKGLDVEEFAAGFVRFENGATLILELSWMLNHKTEGDDMRIWLYGDQGGAVWPECELHKTSNETRQHMDIQLKNIPPNDPYVDEVLAFAKAVAEDLPSPVPPEQSLQVQSILEGIYRSAARGKEVTLRL